MADLLETTRQLHEDIERYEDELVRRIKETPSRAEERIKNDHAIVKLASIIKEKTIEALNIHNSNSLCCMPEVPQDTASPQFQQLLDDFHADADTIMSLFKGKAPVFIESSDPTQGLEVSVPFSGEEAEGTCIDLMTNYTVMLNLVSDEQRKEWKYIDYVREFWRWDAEPNRALRYHCGCAEWGRYVRGLLEYIVGFIQRTQPLRQISQEVQQLEGTTLTDEEDTALRPVMEEMEKTCYCVYCSRQFTKDTVFKGHLKGKKHTEALRVSGESETVKAMWTLQTLMRG